MIVTYKKVASQRQPGQDCDISAQTLVHMEKWERLNRQMQCISPELNFISYTVSHDIFWPGLDAKATWDAWTHCFTIDDQTAVALSLRIPDFANHIPPSFHRLLSELLYSLPGNVPASAIRRLAYDLGIDFTPAIRDQSDRNIIF